MSGKQPKTIFTDQSAAMANAIEDEFPKSNHRLYENEWIVAWNYMLETYDVTDNPWLREMFDVKEKWCMVYGRHMFTADMKSTQCSKSMNGVLKKYLKPKHGLLQFFGHYSRVLSDKRSQELQAEFKMRQTTPVLQFDFEMLRHAAKVYTSEIFKMFQDEYVKIVDCTIYKASKSDSIIEYKVKYRNKTQKYLVKYEASTTTVQCSCMKFSFVGILCFHTLKVLDKKNVKRIPAHYVLKRWTQDANVGSIKDSYGIDVKGSAQESVGKRLSHLSHKCLQINTLATEREMMYEHVDKCFDKLLKDLQEMRIECCLSSMEGEVHGEVVPENVLQGDGGFESHDISQGICGIKTKPTVGRPRGSYSNLVGQDNVVGLNGLNQECFDCEFLVGQDHVGLYGLNQVLVDPDIDNF
ncbi:protein FAR1-RELATED SEQUENCE 5-like [Quercus lobata]|uniref:protein FAR1-RELATED SEQUENCE 5-like n=1 Tax=Quercus lobata TaxID=97700 RepID=UPI001245965E|nr:protein FAR1-RELATED SEQUENCE 5-like [Quercus lobata]